jgi:hypothetical protein
VLAVDGPGREQLGGGNRPRHLALVARVGALAQPGHDDHRVHRRHRRDGVEGGAEHLDRATAPAGAVGGDQGDGLGVAEAYGDGLGPVAREHGQEAGAELGHGHARRHHLGHHGQEDADGVVDPDPTLG